MNHSIPLTLIAFLPAVSNLSADTHYVSLESTNPTAPYTTWAAAATNVQDAVDAATAGDLILVTNGVYATGGRAAGTSDSDNRVLVDKAVTLQSVNGPQCTIIRGDRVINGPPPGGHDAQVIGPRCVLLTDGAILSGFTLTNGTAYGGGGVMAYSTNGVTTNCVIAGNWAPGYTANGFGGGAYRGALYNCVLTGNSATYAGGGAAYSTLYNCVLTSNRVETLTSTGAGAHSCTLYNCTLTCNSAGYYEMPGATCGGAKACTLYNCIVFYNTTPWNSDPNYDSSSTLQYCCTMPMPASGAGNITDDPGFVSFANPRLLSNSPCINAGTNRYAARPTDLDNRPRVVGNRVDMGAYEVQPGVSGAFIGWLQQHGLPTDGSADYADPDADQMNNWEEWVCGTYPTDPLSALRLLSTTPTGIDVTVSWQSIAGVNYLLERSATLVSPFTLVATNLTGQAGTTTYADTNVTAAGPFFYRVGVSAQ